MLIDASPVRRVVCCRVVRRAEPSGRCGSTRRLKPSCRSTSPRHGCASKLVLSFIRPTGCARPHSALRSKHRRRAPCRIAHDAGAPAVSMQCLSGLWAVLHAQTSECTTYIRITFSSSVHFCSESPFRSGTARHVRARPAPKVLGFPKFIWSRAHSRERTTSTQQTTQTARSTHRPLAVRVREAPKRGAACAAAPRDPTTREPRRARDEGWGEGVGASAWHAYSSEGQDASVTDGGGWWCGPP